MKKLILLLAFFTLIVSCSESSKKNCVIKVIDGLKVYRNSNIPSVQDLVISPQEIFRIEGIGGSEEGSAREFAWPRFLDTDSKGNIYIVDTASASVKKFTSKGNFIKSFGKKGTGPGEMKVPIIIALLDHIVFVADPALRRIVKFDTEGNFIGHLILKGGVPNFLQTVGKDKFIGFLNKFQQTEKGVYQSFDLVLMDSQFKEVSTLLAYKTKFNPAYNDFLDRFTPYAVGKDKIFAAENSEDFYKINVFDFSGRLLYVIEKNYQKIAFNKDELDELNDTLEKTIKKFGNPYYQPIQSKFKKSINSMYYDKEGRLLVACSVKRHQGNRHDFLVDVFKHGVFLKKIKINISRGYDFVKLHDEKVFFKGSRIYHLDESTAVVKVFEY